MPAALAIGAAVLFYATLALFAQQYWANPVEVSGTALAAGRHHDRLAVLSNLPGVTQLILKPADESQVPLDETIVGVVIDDEAYAMPLACLSEPTTHVVNLVINGKPISATYCPLSDRVRVLSGSSGNRPLELGVGGIDVNNEMVLKLNNERYAQLSKALPFDDYPFVRQSLRVWCESHPQTIVYEGPVPGSVPQDFAQ